MVEELEEIKKAVAVAITVAEAVVKAIVVEELN